MDAIGYFIVITAVGVIAVIIAGPRSPTRNGVAQEDEGVAGISFKAAVGKSRRRTSTTHATRRKSSSSPSQSKS